MTIQETTSIIALAVSVISLGVAIIAVWISRKNSITAQRNLDFAVEKWEKEIDASNKQHRLDFLRDIFNGFTFHNWKFIEYWQFPGVFPPLDDIQKAIPNKEEENRELFGKRVVALEHLNILFRVFSHKELLLDVDIEGFTHWANNLFDGSREALRTVFGTGDTYPLDFILWLRDVIFKEQDFNSLLGSELRSRLRLYEKSLSSEK